MHIYNHNVITYIYICIHIFIIHSYSHIFSSSSAAIQGGPVTGLLPTARWDAAADAARPGGLQLRSAGAARTGEVGF